MPAAGATRWTNREVAFVLNFADFCLQREGSDFRRGVEQEFLKFANRKVTVAAISAKMRTVPAKQDNVKWADLADTGTQCLDLEKLPRGVIDEMQRQRRVWGLKELPQADDTHRAAPQGEGTKLKAETTIANSQENLQANLQANSQLKQRVNSQQSYREDTVSDSEASTKHLRDDEDFEEQPLRKKQKPNPAARNQTSNRQRSTTAPPNKAKPKVHKSQHKTATAGQSPVPEARADCHKRKLSSADIIDLAGAPPSPKRQALGSAFSRTEVENGTTVTLPELRGTAGDIAVQDAPLIASMRAQAQSHIVPTTENAFENHEQSKVFVRGNKAAATVPPRTQSQKTAMPAVDKQVMGPRQVNPPSAFQKPQSPTEPTSTIEAVRDLTEIVAVLLRQQTVARFGMTEEVESRLRCIQRTTEREPGQFLAKMLQDLNSIDAAREDLSRLVHDLVTRRELNRENVFPRDLDSAGINRSWKALRTYVEDAFGFEDCDEPLPRAEDAGYVAARIDDLANNKCASGLTSPKQFLEELKDRLESPHLVQATLAALLCGWLFSGPEPMCEDIYSPKELELYCALLLTRGAAEVQQLDKIGMKLLFEDKNFKSSLLQLRAERILADLEASLKYACPIAPGFKKLNTPQEWAETAVELKQTLMLNAHEFRIHNCMPGTQFNPTWMQAMNYERFPIPDEDAMGRNIAVGLFPALTAHDAPPFSDSATLEDVLAKNKTFFPSFEEKRGLDAKQVIAKASVLLL
ncbi:hypothetical protein HBH70_050320 [Parastagonospora nodorum]|nr:hypothetical protein HBI01_041160 [Parastagonospora nodorum]KAH4314110.1 hypothetical protein HBI02_068640 [Parastagonospora nodorum]KAH4333715.1 hypothetical protein HBI00_039330 [Parastagonospora nodorum]KAH4379301.1 hypothetical protein HBH94_081140 [Parastagonospora nodorum]KAH4472419.1 hypothetical protein HBH90_047730 [Parastagonospora nodorum]